LKGEGETIEKNEDGPPVGNIREKKGEDAISIEGPVPGAKDADWIPAEFEPEEITVAHGEGDPGNEAKKIECDFGQDDLMRWADPKERGLQKIKKIHKKAIESKKEEVPARAPKSFPVPRSVRADEGANGFWQNGSGECGEECGEREAPGSFPSSKRIDSRR
jgi:hypothetical protein